MIAQSRRDGPNFARLRRAGELPFRGCAGPLLTETASDEQLEVYAQDALRLGHILINGGARYTWTHSGTATSRHRRGRVGTGEPAAHQGIGVAGISRPSFKERGWTFANVAAATPIVGNPEAGSGDVLGVDAAVAYAPWPTVTLEGRRLPERRRQPDRLLHQRVYRRRLLIFTPTNVALAAHPGYSRRRPAGPRAPGPQCRIHLPRCEEPRRRPPLDRRAAHTGRLRGTETWDLLHGLRADVTALYTGAAPLVGEAFGGGVEVTGEQGAFLQWNLDLQIGSVPGTEPERRRRQPLQSATRELDRAHRAPFLDRLQHPVEGERRRRVVSSAIPSVELLCASCRSCHRPPRSSVPGPRGAARGCHARV